MNKIPVSVASLVVAAAVGVLAWRYISLDLWEPAFPGVFVALSMLGAAVLVRLARNAPITAPTAFNEEDLKLFFDALEILARRLFAIFAQVVVALSVVIASIVVLKNIPTAVDTSQWKAAAPYCSGAMAFFITWVLLRLLEMTYGDIGFLRLQRRILEHALERERIKEASKKVAAPVNWTTKDGYGRALT